MKNFFILILFFFNCYSIFAAKELIFPTATISGGTTVCQNATNPLITFTGISGTAPYTFTYTLTGVSGNQTIITTSGNSVTLNAPTGVAGTFIYSLVSVQDASVTQAQTGSTTVIVNSPPIIDFSFTNNTTCSGTAIQFNSTLTGTGSYTFSWDFGDNTPISTAQNPTHIFNSLGCGNANFNVVLTVTGNGCTVTKSYSVTVKQKPDINFEDVNATSATNQFSNCQNASLTNQIFSITVGNISASICTTSYSINWGDSVVENNVVFPKSHTYNLLGVYTMTVTGLGSNGCITTKTYTVKNISNPAAGVLNPGGTTDMCLPTGINQYTIGNWGQNSPGTTYSVDYGDGFILPLNQNDMILTSYYNASNPSSSANYPIPHSYTTNSCPLPKFIIKLTVTNACKSTEAQVDGGNTISKTIADFSAPLNNCVNSSVLFTNISSLGFVSGCIKETKFIWNFGDSASGTLNTINTGFVNNNPNANHIFSSPGNYTVTLTATNSCGTTTKTQTICVESQLTPQFTLNTTSGCTPLAITATNNTYVTNSCTTPTYNWLVTYTAANCGTSITPIPFQTTPNATYNFTEAGSYAIKLTVTNSCGSFNTTQTVTVKKSPIISIAPINNFCGTATINPVATVPACVQPSNALTYDWSFPGGNPSAANTLNPGAINYSTTGTFQVSLVVTNECGASNTATQSFTVNESPTITNTSLSQTICSGTQTTLVNLITNPATPTISWTASATAGISGFTTSGTNTIPVQTISTNGTTVGTVTYVITPKIGTCTGAIVNYVVTVNPAAQVNQPTSISYCNATVTSPINFTTTNPSGTIFSWTNSNISIGLVASGNGNLPSFTATNTTSNPITATITVTPSFSGGSIVCSGVSKTFIITINPIGQVNQPTDLTKCSGESVITNFSTSNSVTGTTTYNWTNNTPAIGLPSSGNGNLNFTTTNTSTAILLATITVTPTYSLGSISCIGTPKTFMIAINPSAQVNQPTSISVCNGSTIPIINFSSSNTSVTTSYNWTNSNTSIGLSISGTGGIPSFTAINTGNSLQVATIIVTPTYLVGSTSCSGATKQFTISVAPNASVNTIIDKYVCNGNSLPAIQFFSGTTGGTNSYSWINSNTSIGLPATGNGNISSFTAINTGLLPVTATISVTPTLTNGSLVCSGMTQNFIITVNPSGQVNLINPIEVCNGNSVPSTIFSTANSGGTITYSWINSNTNIGLAGSGIGSIPSFNATNTSSTPLIATVTITPTFTNGGVGCNQNSQTFTIKVNPSPTGTILGTIDVCLNASQPQITFTGFAGNAPYTFTYNINGGTNQTITTTTGNSVTLNATTNILGTFTYNLVKVLDSNATSCLNTISQSAIVTVNAAPTINLQPIAKQSICIGGSIITPLTVSFNNGTGTPTYQWYINSSNSTANGVAVGTNSDSYTPSIFNTAGTFYYYVTISFSGNGCGSIISAFAVINIINDPIISSQPIVSQILCQNAIPTNLVVATTGGIGIFSYQWFSNSTNNPIGGNLINGETNATFTPSTTNAGAIYYYCEITQPNGIGCNVTSQTSEIIINVAPTISDNPISSTVCLGNNPILLSVNYINGVGTPTYQWFSNTVNSNSGGNSINNENTSSFNPPSNTAGIYYYYCVVTFATLSGGCEIVTSNNATVTIEQVPVVTSQNLTICSNSTFTITPTNSSSDIVPASTTYTWSTPTISPIGAITESSSQNVPQNSISQTLINITTSPATATYTITPKSGNCIGTNFTVTITINPATNPNAVVTNSTCYGINNGSISTNITGGIPFLTNPPYTILWTGPNSFATNQSTISNLIPGLYNLSISDAGGCPISNNYTITEPLEMILTTDVNNNITCFGNNNGAISISVTGGTGTYSYVWTKNGTNFATTEDITNLSPATYIVSVTDANNCPPKILTFTISESPILSVNLISKTNVACFGFATGTITINTTGGTPTETSPGIFNYTYSWTGANGYASSSQNLTVLLAGTYNLVVTDSLGCSKNLSVTIIQSTEIIITATTTPIECYGDNDATINTTISGGNAPYQIQWSNLAIGLNQNNLSPGNYTITITDNLGCIKSLTINIPSPPIFTINPVVSNISCFGANDGSIVLNFVGGIAPVNLVWSDESPAGITRNNLSAGTYSVVITDSKLCTITRAFIILEPQLLILSANTTNALDCNNANSGSINLLVSGGTPPFNYVWNNGIITEDLSNIPAGNYSVTVTDFRGCTKLAQYSITRPSPIVMTVATTTVANCATNSVTQNFTAQVSGGVPPFQFNWSSGTAIGSNNEIMTTTQNGLVTLVATDAIGCSSNYSLNVLLPVLGNPTFTQNSIGFTSYGIYSILDPIQFNSTITGDYISVLWDFGDGIFSNELNPIHTYLIPNEYYLVTQTVTYLFGCIYKSELALNVEKGYLLVMPTGFTPNNNDGVNDTLRPVTKALKNIRLDIYDTWGSLIYSEVGEVLVGWNGKIKNINSENGNYYAKVSAETFYGKTINENQTFVLIK